MEHKNQKKNQKNAKSSKNNSIDDLFHMKDNDLVFDFMSIPLFIQFMNLQSKYA